MAHPVDSARPTTSISTAATSHNINVGSPVDGDLLVVAVRFAGAPGTVTFTGYSLLASDATDASDDTTAVWYRLADGTEGASDVLGTPNSVKLAAICWVIKGAELPQNVPPRISAVAIGTTAANTCNPNVITPSGATLDYLFLAFGGQDGEVGAYTAEPTNYVNLAATNSGTGGAATSNVIIGGASRQLRAAGDDPGAFTHGAANSAWTAFAIAVLPTRPRHSAVDHINPGVFMSGLRDSWRRRSGIVVPKLWLPEGAVI